MVGSPTRGSQEPRERSAPGDPTLAEAPRRVLGIPCLKFCWTVAEAISVQHGLITNFGNVAVTGPSKDVLEKLKAGKIHLVCSKSRGVASRQGGRERVGQISSRPECIQIPKLMVRSVAVFFFPLPWISKL